MLTAVFVFAVCLFASTQTGRPRTVRLGVCTISVGSLSAHPSIHVAGPWPPPFFFRWAPTVHSFGMIMYEIFSKRIPYEDVRFEHMVCKAILSGERPPLPHEAPELLQELMTACWQPQPQDRPTINVVVQRLEYLAEFEGGAPRDAAAAADSDDEDA